MTTLRSLNLRNLPKQRLLTTMTSISMLEAWDDPSELTIRQLWDIIDWAISQADMALEQRAFATDTVRHPRDIDEYFLGRDFTAVTP